MKRLPVFPTIIGTVLGVGFWPWGSGTMGALAGVLIWYALSLYISPCLLFYSTITGILLFTVLGTWATHRLMPFWGDDPKQVVIDETVGVWIPLLATPATELWIVVLSFVLFRLFDIFKPIGIRLLDNKKGAFYVMADDLAAGLYSLLIIVFVRWIL